MLSWLRLGGKGNRGGQSKACGCRGHPSPETPSVDWSVSETVICLGPLQGHTDELWGLAIHASKPQFLTCGHDRHATLWDAAGHRPVWDKMIEVDMHITRRFSCKSSSGTRSFMFLRAIDSDRKLSQSKRHPVCRFRSALP